jgi:hypothetical protein
MNVGLTIRYYEQSAVPQPVANVDGKSFRGPERIRSLAQLGLFFRCGTSRCETCGEVCHFVCEWPEQIQIWYARSGRSLAHAQRTHPLRCPGNGTSNAPAHNQQGGKCNQED